MGTLDGKAAVVTGGSRGIGRAIVGRLAKDGASVVFSFSENRQAADEVVTEVASLGGQAFAVQADQGRIEDQKLLFEEAGRRLGGLDILVNNAAIGEPTAILDVTDADYDRVMDVNSKGPFFAMQYAGRALRDGGRIINISTLNTVVPSPGVALYAASKAALEQFTAWTCCARPAVTSPVMAAHCAGRCWSPGSPRGASAALGLGRAPQSGADHWFRLGALAPISGAYDFQHAELPAILDGELARLNPSPQLGAKYSVLYAAYTLVAFNRLHHIYTSPAEVFKRPYAHTIQRLIDGNHTGKEVFNGTPGT